MNKKVKKVCAMIAVFLVIQMMICIALSVIGTIRFRDCKNEYYSELKNLSEIALGDNTVVYDQPGSELLAIYNKMDEFSRLGGYKGAVKYREANYYTEDFLQSKQDMYIIGVPIEDSAYDAFFDVSKYFNDEQLAEYKKILNQDCALYSVSFFTRNNRYIPVEIVYKEIKIVDDVSQFTDKIVFQYNREKKSSSNFVYKYYDSMVEDEISLDNVEGENGIDYVGIGSLWDRVYDNDDRLYQYLGKYDSYFSSNNTDPEKIDSSELIISDGNGLHIDGKKYYLFKIPMTLNFQYEIQDDSDFYDRSVNIDGLAIYDIDALAWADEGFRSFMITVFIIFEVVTLSTIISILVIQRNNKKLDRMRNTFINAMAHEMKTPAAVIVNTSEVILEGINPEKTKHYQTIVRDEAQHISDLLSDMLIYSRMIGQGYKFNNTNINMEQLVASMIKHYEQQMEKKSIKYSFQKESDWILKTDEKLMSMILDNLISNAVKYAKDNGNVKITLKNGFLSVFNNGEQIPENNLKDIWTPLFKSDSSRSDKDGSGMGLAISAEILKQMKLSYTAENVDGGVLFSIYKKGCK